MAAKRLVRIKARHFYVYAYLNPDGSPYYIGKGSNKRALMPHTAEASCPSDPSKVIRLASGLDEELAYFLEARLIAQYGRKANGTGPLLNICPGRPAATGLRYPSLTKEKVSAMGRCSELKA